MCSMKTASPSSPAGGSARAGEPRTHAMVHMDLPSSSPAGGSARAGEPRTHAMVYMDLPSSSPAGRSARAGASPTLYSGPTRRDYRKSGGRRYARLNDEGGGDVMACQASHARKKKAHQSLPDPSIPCLYTSPFFPALFIAEWRDDNIVDSRAGCGDAPKKENDLVSGCDQGPVTLTLRP